MLMKYFSGSRNRISQANSPCLKCMKQTQLSKDRLKVAQVIVLRLVFGWFRFVLNVYSLSSMQAV